MTLRQFAQMVRKDYGLSACYIAIMPNDGKYDLEVEASEGSIAGTYATRHPCTRQGLRLARAKADELDRHLTDLGVRVHKTRDEWDDFLAGREYDTRH